MPADSDSKLSLLESGINSARDKESFILNLLTRRAQQINKPLHLTPSDIGFVDAYAPDGFENFEGPSVIEIKGSVFDIKSIIRTLSNLKSVVIKRKLRNIIFIFQTNIDGDRSLADSFAKTTFNTNDVSVYFLGIEYIDNIISDNLVDLEILKKSSFEQAVRGTVNYRPTNWKLQRDEVISDLVASYQMGQFSLFLGAGVSASAGMPDWETLINSLFVEFLSETVEWPLIPTAANLQTLVQRLNTLNDPSTLMSARYIRKGLTGDVGNYEKFRQSVTKSLYGRLRDKENHSSNLLTKIASLCRPQRMGAKVRSIVTYNFDDLIERQLNQKDIRFKSIYNETGILDQNELPIFHVHGFLPEETANHFGLNNSTLVFSEEGYHQIYTESYHWSNLVQLNSLRENHCLMIGLSLSDPNLRRLLDISSKYSEKPKHFAFMKRLSADSFCNDLDAKGKKVRVLDNDEIAETFLDSHHRLSERVMAELGVRAVWFEKYEEIPTILQKLI